MLLSFYKMVGDGRDFVMVDNRDLAYSEILTHDNIADICNRRFGVGADGLIAVEPPQVDGAHARMRYYNSGGEETETCGNGAQCFTAFVDFLAEGGMREVRFQTTAGIVKGVVNDDDSITVAFKRGAGNTSAGDSITGPALITFRGQLLLPDE